MAEATLHLDLYAQQLADWSRPMEPLFARRVIRECERAVKTTVLKPVMTQARTAMGLAYLRLERNEDALHQFEEAARLDPGRVSALKNVALANAESGRFSRAVVGFERAMRTEPHDVLLIANYAKCLWDDGQLHRAEGILASLFDRLKMQSHSAIFIVGRNAILMGLEQDGIRILANLFSHLTDGDVPSPARTLLAHLAEWSLDRVLSPQVLKAIETRAKQEPVIEIAAPAEAAIESVPPAPVAKVPEQPEQPAFRLRLATEKLDQP